MPVMKAVLTACLGGAATASAESVRVGHWNLFWRALSDKDGLAAITAGVDAAAAQSPYDFFSLVEATGNGAGQFPDWLNTSKAFHPDTGMRHIQSHSGHEIVALLYQSGRWSPAWMEAGDMGSGRPYVVGLFEDHSGYAAPGAEKVWVMAAHLPHWPQVASYKPGATLAAALQNGSAATGRNVAADPVLIMGDFNEFAECSMPPDPKCSFERYRPTVAGIAPLWSFFPTAAMVDAVPFNTTTCCTKWHESLDDWRHHFDRIFYSRAWLSKESGPTFIPYAYPGTASPCADPACIGDKPPGGVAPSPQGSWHRGWVATFGLGKSARTSELIF